MASLIIVHWLSPSRKNQPARHTYKLRVIVESSWWRRYQSRYLLRRSEFLILMEQKTIEIEEENGNTRKNTHPTSRWAYKRRSGKTMRLVGVGWMMLRFEGKYFRRGEKTKEKGWPPKKCEVSKVCWVVHWSLGSNQRRKESGWRSESPEVISSTAKLGSTKSLLGSTKSTQKLKLSTTYLQKGENRRARADAKGVAVKGISLRVNPSLNNGKHEKLSFEAPPCGVIVKGTVAVAAFGHCQFG